MATDVVEGTGPRVVPVDTGNGMMRPVAMAHLSWGAIIGGAVSALALWLLLYAFGMAVGLSTVDQNDPGSLKSSGIFAGIWGVIAPLLALFLGGLVAARGAGMQDRGSGALHGLVMWGLTTLLGAWMVTNLLSTVAGGMASVGKAAAQAGVSGVTSAAGQSGDLMASLGVDANSLLGPINQRLRSEGKPTLTAEQLQAVGRDVAGDALRQGRMDRNMLMQSIVQHTPLSRADAEDLATRMSTEFDQRKGQLSAQVDRAKDTAQQGALKVADATGKAFWGIFAALFLGMISAVLGAVTGVSRRQRLAAARTAPPPGSPRPVLRSSEV